MPEESPSAGPIRFGVFELDLRSGELRKAGVRVSLQEQALQVLTSLVERPGDLVTRDELRQRLWPNGTFVRFRARPERRRQSPARQLGRFGGIATLY
jgi:DNA-binding response OmpR family regulator